MADLIPWDTLSMVFVASPTAPRLNGPGRPTLDLRLVMGALFVQHIEGLSDERTLELINENVYVQFFCGFPGFQVTPAFDSSSLTHWRAWLGDSGAAALSETLADIFEQRRMAERNDNSSTEESDDEDGDISKGESTDEVSATTAEDQPASKSQPLKPNQGSLLLDATCAPANISYPTDTGLLNHARLSLESIIDILWSACVLRGCAPSAKPRTYRTKARKAFAGFSRKRRPSMKLIRKQRRRQLQWVERDLKHVDSLYALLIEIDAHQDVLSAAQYKRLLVCSELARQQREMLDAKSYRCDHRIVSLDQPHIRPIVRGKAGARVEFGPKLDVSLSNGIARVEAASFEAYHEGCVAIAACERYAQRHGYYPAKIFVDKAYLSNTNRAYFKLCGIIYVAKPQGRPPKDPAKRAIYDAAMRESQTPGERNPIEGWFGLAKRRYRLGNLMSRKAKHAIGELFLVTMAVNIMGELARVLLCLFYTLHNAQIEVFGSASNNRAAKSTYSNLQWPVQGRNLTIRIS